MQSKYYQTIILKQSEYEKNKKNTYCIDNVIIFEYT